jgi:hypothetical protein
VIAKDSKRRNPTEPIQFANMPRRCAQLWISLKNIRHFGKITMHGKTFPFA